MVFRHPKYYAELRKQRRLQARKPTSSQANEPSPQALEPRVQAASQSSQAKVSVNQGTSKPSPYPGHKQQE